MGFFDQHPQFTEEFKQKEQAEYRRNKALAKKRREKEEIARRRGALPELLQNLRPLSEYNGGECQFCHQTVNDCLLGVCPDCADREAMSSARVS